MIIAEHITVLVAKIGSEIVGSGYMDRNRKTTFKS
jgi:hypothetical protein